MTEFTPPLENTRFSPFFDFTVLRPPGIWRGDFFLVAPGESKFIPGRGNPRWSTKKYSLAFLAGRFFSGCSRGVEVYPRQGKSPLEHQKNLLAFWRGDFFWLLYCAIAIVRLCAHIIIIYNDIHARAEPAGILQKIRV